MGSRQTKESNMGRLNPSLTMDFPKDRTLYLWCHACGRWVRYDELRMGELAGIYRHTCGLALIDFEDKEFDERWLNAMRRKKRKQ
jgi:hypothetical protein